GTANGDAVREVAVHDLPAGAVDDVQAGEEVPADDDAAGEAQNDHQAGAPEQHRGEQRFELAPLVNIAGDEEQEALRQSESPAARASKLGFAADTTLIGEFDQSVFRGLHLRPSVEISGDHSAVVVGEQIQSLIASDRTADNDIRQSGQALPLILF